MKNIFKTSLLVIVSMGLLTGCTLFNKSNETTDTQTQQEQENSGNQNITLKQALSLGQSTKCTYNAEGDNITVQIKGKKIRVDGITFNSENETTDKGGVINDGEWVYIWGENQKTGMKYKLTDLEKIASGSGTNQQSEEWGDPQEWANEAEEKYDVTCSPGIATDAQFVPPSDIQFEDLGKLMEGLKGIIPSENSTQDTSGINMDELNKAIQDMGIENEE